MPHARRLFLLDVMSTLVRDPFYEDIPAFLGMSLERLLAEKDPRTWIDFEHGGIEEHELFERFFADRRPIDGPGLRAVTFAGYRLLPGVGDLLAELRAAGAEMHALSNYPVWYHAIEERTRLSRFLSWSFVSCDMGHRKPDAEAFRLPLRRLGAAPEDVVFVDDNAGNVEAAAALGLDAIRFTGADELRAALVSRGVL